MSALCRIRTNGVAQAGVAGRAGTKVIDTGSIVRLWRDQAVTAGEPRRLNSRAFDVRQVPDVEAGAIAWVHIVGIAVQAV